MVNKNRLVLLFFPEKFNIASASKYSIKLFNMTKYIANDQF